VQKLKYPLRETRISENHHPAVDNSWQPSMNAVGELGSPMLPSKKKRLPAVGATGIEEAGYPAAFYFR
jgi:hypothetical protein